MEHQSVVSLLFEDPFWVIIFERYYGGTYSVARVVVGSSEPSEGQLSELVNLIDSNILKFTEPTREDKSPIIAKINFKRKLREAKKLQMPEGAKNVFTQSQAHIKQQQIDIKVERKHQKRLDSEIDAKKKFLLKQKKKKKKHNGH